LIVADASSPGESGQNFIAAERVRKIYRSRGGATEALSSISFGCDRGQFISLLGPSGCGKSTLLMIIAGLEAVSSGAVSIGGEPILGPRPDVGVIFQDPTLLPWRSALDNVLFPIEIMRLPMDRYRDRAIELLTQLGLGNFLKKRPHELSGGMRQRVAICRALIHDPDILLMDEPFSALDAITRDQMNELLAGLLQRYRKTVLFVTHSIREAVFLSDRVLVMGGRPGRIVAAEPVEFARPRLRSLEDEPAFADICRRLREYIESSYTGANPVPPAMAG
jgi:NitT/TauT family transport system ATP-binding protein